MRHHSIIALGIIGLCLRPAFALEETTPGKADARITTAKYEPTQIYAVHIAKGQSFVIAVNQKETISDIYGGDKIVLMAERDQLGHTISLHTETDINTPRIFTIVTRYDPDGSTRRYMLQVDTAPISSTAQISLTFTYPAEVTAAQVAAWRAAQAAKEQQATQNALTAARQAEHCDGEVNRHYLLQGLTQSDWDLLPTRQVCDNGEKTYFTFPGNMTIPIIYATDNDGKEILAEYTFDSVTRVATVHQLSRAFHLRDGDSLLCIFNKAYDPVGVRSTSGTITPDVQRVTK